MKDTPADIPGFYYDKVKRRYFRITPDHRAAKFTAAAQYSRSEVNRRLHPAIHNQCNGTDASSESVTRSRLIWDRNSAYPLSRETGVFTQVNPSDLWPAAFSVKTLFDRNLFASDTCHATTVEDVASSVETQHSFALMNCLGRQSTQILVQHESSRAALGTGSSSWTELAELGGTGRSLVRSEGSVPLIAVIMSSGTFLHMRLQDIVSFDEAQRNSSFTEMPSFLHHQLYLRRNNELSDLAANPSQSTAVCIFAVAGSTHNLLYMDMTGTRVFRTAKHQQEQASNALAVSWQNHSVLSTGYRNGNIDIQDLRARDGTLRLRHESVPRRLRYVGDSGYFLLVAGLSDKLAMYDLRFSRYPSYPDLGSTPYLRYPQYRNGAQIHSLGFDVSSSLNLVAAANDSETGVSLFDLWRGTEKKRSCQKGREQLPLTQPPCSAIKFFGSNESHQGIEGCLVATNLGIQCWE